MASISEPNDAKSELLDDASDREKGVQWPDRRHQRTASLSFRPFRLFDRLPRFIADTATLAGTTLAGQAVFLVSTPVLTRLYGPEQFGAFAMYLMLVSIPLIFVSWRYELAIPVANKGADAAHLLVASLLLTLGTSGILAILLTFLGRQLVVYLQTPELYQYLWLAPVGLMFAGCTQAWTYMAIRCKAFSGISAVRMSQALVQVGVQLAAGVTSGGLLGLLAGELTGRIQSAGMAIFWTWRHRHEFFRQISLVALVQVLVRYRQYPLLLSGSSMLNSVSQHLPIIFLTTQYGVGVAGAYALAQRVAQYPLTIVGNAVGQVFLSRGRDDLSNQRLAETSLHIYHVLLSAGLPFATLLLVTGKQLFGFAFGSRWLMAGQFTSFLAPWLLLVFVGSPLSSLIAICNKQRSELRFQAVLLSGRLLVLIVSHPHADPNVSVCLFGAVSALLWGVYVVWLLLVAGNNGTRILSGTLSEFLGVAPVIVPLAVVRVISTDDTTLVVAGCLGAALLIVRFFVVQWFSMDQAGSILPAAAPAAECPISLGGRQ